MLKKDLVEYIDEPWKLNEDTIFELTLLAEKYPYFQVAQLLRVKNLHNLSPESIKPVLSYTAAYVTDRKILYYLLHPIKEAKSRGRIKSPEKVIKDSIGENISDTLNNQLAYLKNNAENSIGFTASMDIRKEYGDGVELDEYVVRITDDGPELIELIEESEDKAQIVPEEKNVPETPKEEDVLTLIYRGVSAEKVAGEPNLSVSQQKSYSIIDSFLKANPKIKPEASKGKEITDFSVESIKESDHLITDTLANIYMKQGNYAKALFAYEKLSLKYPEKSAYFGHQIEEIKKIIENSK